MLPITAFLAVLVVGGAKRFGNALYPCLTALSTAFGASQCLCTLRPVGTGVRVLAG